MLSCVLDIIIFFFLAFCLLFKDDITFLSHVVDVTQNHIIKSFLYHVVRHHLNDQMLNKLSFIYSLFHRIYWGIQFCAPTLSLTCKRNYTCTTISLNYPKNDTLLYLTKKVSKPNNT